MTKTAKTAKTASAHSEPRFSEALLEIESILRRVEGDDVDIDELATELERAATLLEICRAKIRRAEGEVQQVTSRLVEDQGGGPGVSASSVDGDADAF